MSPTTHKYNKSYLITGGTGSIGSEIARSLIASGAKNLTIFSRDDSKHFYLQQELGSLENVRYVIGDVRDRNSLAVAFEERVDVVIHAAALKHVLICEQNPTEAVKTNIIGTQNVVDLAKRSGVQTMITISTDKAVNPSSTMGASKYIAEKLTLDGNSTGKTIFSCVRFGNVLGSRGSVIPNMLKGIRERGVLWISDKTVTRFAMPIPDAARLVLNAAEACQGGEIFVLKMKTFSLGQLIEVMKSMKFSGKEFQVELRGVIDAEKIHEELISNEEANRLWETDTHFVIAPGEAWEPRTQMRKASVVGYSSENAEMFTNRELQNNIEECMVSLGIE